MKKIKFEIGSSGEAALLAANLKSIWSAESYLSLKTLIYVASLLEKILERPIAPHVKNKRPRSAWQQFLSVELRTGSTIQQAAKKWREREKTA